MEPLVSVIMASYNDEKYVRDSINSMLNQTYSNIEIIVIDDCSHDSTREILKSLSSSVVTIKFNKKNMKLAHNLNYAISLAKGDYIARMDADDISVPNRIEKQVKYLETHPSIDVLGSYAKTFGNYRTIMSYPLDHEAIKCELLFNNSLCHPAIMFRRETLDFKYDESFSTSQDYELWSRIIWSKQIANIPDILLNYRVHNKQTAKVRGKSQVEGADCARLKMLKHVFPDLEGSIVNDFLLACDISKPKNEKEFVNIESFFMKLIKKNDEVKVFDPYLLEKKIGEVFFQHWYNSVGYSGVTFKTILNSPYSDIYREKNCSVKMKIFVKNIIRKLNK